MVRIRLMRKDGIVQYYHVRLTKRFKESHVKVGKAWQRREVLYRSSVVRTYYAERSDTGRTPEGEEFADLRVEVVSKGKLSDADMRIIEQRLDRLQSMFPNIRKGVRSGNVAFRVTGYEENVMIDADEARIGSDEEVTFRRDGRKYGKGWLERYEASKEIMPGKPLRQWTLKDRYQRLLE